LILHRSLRPAEHSEIRDLVLELMNSKAARREYGFYLCEMGSNIFEHHNEITSHC
jgi:hypothetical protein